MTDDPRGTTREAARLRGAVALDHLAPGHALPISNGWSSYGGAVVVWCGQCRHLYQPGADWAARYLAARWHTLARNAANPRHRTTAANARRAIAELAAELAAGLAPAGVTFTWQAPS